MSKSSKKPADPEGGEYTASDVRKTAGLSYRQLNDWDEKGVLPGQRGDRKSWRKFSAREVFVLMVSAELRKQFGVPVEKLRYVQSCMLQKGANHFRAAIDYMARGQTVWLLTDCHSTFIMDPDNEFEDLFGMGFFRGDDERAFAFMRINPIVNRILACLKEPIRLETRPDMYDLLHEVRSAFRVQNEDEFHLLRVVRNPDVHSVSVQLRDGEIVGLKTKQEHAGKGRTISENELAKVLHSGDFQTVTVTKHNGRVIRLTQEVPHSSTQTKATRRKK